MSGPYPGISRRGDCGPAVRAKAKAFLAALSEADRACLVAVLEHGDNHAAADMAEERGYPRRIVKVMTLPKSDGSAGREQEQP